MPYSAFGRYYIRVADEDRELTPSELRKIMINKEYEDAWENKLSQETPQDVNDASLEKFYHEAVSCGRMPEMREYSKEELLKKLGLLSKGKLTNAGKQLFSSNHPIVLKLAVFATEHKTTFLDISRNEGNIFELIDSAMGYLIRNIRWRAEIDGTNAKRRESPEVPLEAIREAVINSFAHARYDLAVQHEIDVFSDRISIVNPGAFANEYSPDDFFDMDLRSYLRNESIANVLYLCKEVESFGSGLKRIYLSCMSAGVEISYENSETSFMIEFSRKDRNNVSKEDTLNGTLSGQLTDNESRVLAFLREYGHLTSAELVEKVEKSRRTVNRITTSLTDKGMIERIGSKKTGYWQAR